MPFRRWSLLLAGLVPFFACAADPAPDAASTFDFQWGVKIPLRDGVKLNAALYRPRDQRSPLPCILTMTPYTVQRMHDRGRYFAGHGYVYVAVDVRGRGNSEGEFQVFAQEANDGPDVVEWLAKQSYCDGKIAMLGGSYLGYTQWATAKEKPPHLATIVPVAAVKPGTDFPRASNIMYAYAPQWLTHVTGHTVQTDILTDDAFWSAQFARREATGVPFKDLDMLIGNPLPAFQTWIAHPSVDAYWDGLVPTDAQYANLDLPILTVTGQYDADQRGALTYYREDMAQASAQAQARHYLVIGPWDHSIASSEAASGSSGLKFGPASHVDMFALQRAWYDWTLKNGARPDFLKNKVAYYVLGEGAEEWRYAPSLERVSSARKPLYLASAGGTAGDVFAAGSLDAGGAHGKPDRYVYDPLHAASFDAFWGTGFGEDNSALDQTDVYQAHGDLLVYHSAPFAEATDLAGFFKFSAWIAIDQPDTDFGAMIYEVTAKGESRLIGYDFLRARYRTSLREAVPVRPGAVERYDFDRFNFVARRIGKGSRLRLVLEPLSTRFVDRNLNSGRLVAEETPKDARTVTVNLYHDAAHPSALYLPIAAAPAEH